MWRPNRKQVVMLVGGLLSVGAPWTREGLAGVALIWTIAAGLLYWLESNEPPHAASRASERRNRP